MLLSDGREDGGDFGDSEGGDSDGCDSDGWDEGWSEGCDEGGGSDGSLLGTDDGLLLGADEGLLLGVDDGGSSDDGLLLGGLLGDDGLLLSDDGLLLCDDGGEEEGDDEGDDEGDEDDPLLLLDFGQQPSPSARTSHLSLSAKCFAKPYVPAGITTGPPELPLDSSGNRRPIESTTVNVRSTGQ